MADPTWPRRIEVWQTSDGAIHVSPVVAARHQQATTATTNANELLVAGKSLGEALRRSGLLPAGELLVLDEVYATTELVIESWQGRATPGYRPLHVTRDGWVYAWGDVGAKSGPYGATCTPREIAEYWLDTKRRAARGTEPSRG